MNDRVRLELLQYSLHGGCIPYVRVIGPDAGGRGGHGHLHQQVVDNRGLRAPGRQKGDYPVADESCPAGDQYSFEIPHEILSTQVHRIGWFERISEAKSLMIVLLR